MATISSTGIGTAGLDVKNIISQLVTLEKRPLDNLKLQAATYDAKISAFGQIKSMVSTLNDAASKLTSVTGWNAVSTTSSDTSFVTGSAIGGTLPTSFAVEVTAMAKAQSTASTAIPSAQSVGAGTLKIELGKWATGKGPGDIGNTDFTATSSVDITVSATDKVADIASKINGANAGVTATILTAANGDQRLLLSGKNTGEVAAFRVSALEGADTDPYSAGNTDGSGLSRLANATIDTVSKQAAKDAAATVNGIAVTSSTNVFANTVAGVTFTAQKQTDVGKPVTITVAKDTSAVKANIDAFVKAYNDINDMLNDATKYDPATKKGGMFQGDSTTVGLQNMLRSAIQNITTGSSVFHRLADVGIEQQRGGNLSVDSTKLTKAMNDNMDELKNMFRNTTDAGGAADGIAVKFKALTTNLLATGGFFQTKDSSYKLALQRNSKDQEVLNKKVDSFEARLTARYNALDTQMSKLTALNAYVSQQVTTWNKASG